MIVIDNLETLKELYGDHFDPHNLVKVQDVNGQKFYMIKEDNPSVLDAGYIILKDGTFLKIDQSQDHDNVFSYFLTLYQHLPELKEYGSGPAATSLNKFGFLVYFGIKSRYMGEMEIKGFSENYSQDISLNPEEKRGGTFILSLPDEITDEQKQSIKMLLDSYDKVCNDVDMSYELIIGNIEQNTSLSRTEIDKMISPKQK